MKQLISEKLINKALSIITAFVMVFLSIAPTYTTAFAAETERNDSAATPDTPESALTEQTLTATIYKNGRYKTVLDDDPTEITLTGRMPEGAVVKAYPVEYDLTPTERDDQPISGSAPDTTGEVLLSYDISIFDGKKEFEPDGDSISVTFKSPEIEKFTDNKLSVIHVKDNGEEEEVVEKAADNGELTITASEFSVYIIVDHQSIHTLDDNGARVMFHFLKGMAEPPKNQSIEAIPYTFTDKEDVTRSVQIIKNGEMLEKVEVNNITQTNTNTNEDVVYYFNGWYIVNYNDADNTYQWDLDPVYVNFDVAADITFNSDDNTITLSLGDVDSTLPVDYTTTSSADGSRESCAHVYIAPIYSEFHYVNFYDVSYETWQREKAEDASHQDEPGYTAKAKRTLLSRKLIVMGLDAQADIRIGDIEAYSDDAKHLVFTGWESSGESIITQSDSTTPYPTRDSNGYELKRIYNKNGMTVTGSDENAAGTFLRLEEDDIKVENNIKSEDIHLYPIFTNARWLIFNNNGAANASYIDSQYLLTNDLLTGTYLTELPKGTRKGYTFAGWYTDPDCTTQIADGNGDIVGTAGVYTKNGRISRPADFSSATNTDGWLYEIYNDNGTNKLYLYNSIPTSDPDGLTLYAKWTPELTTTYKVVVWKQQVTDDVNATDDEKQYDFEVCYTSGTIDPDVSVDPTRFTPLGGTSMDLTKLSSTTAYTGFSYNASKSDMSGKPASDSSTVYNIYYDRNVRTLHFQVDSGKTYTWAETTSNSGTQYGLVDGGYKQLTREGNGEVYHTYTIPTYTPSDREEETMYRLDNGRYVELRRRDITTTTSTDVDVYVQTDRLTSGGEYLIVSSSTAGTGYALGYDRATITSNDDVTINAGISATSNSVYIVADDVNDTSKWTVSSGYTFKNGNYYLNGNGNTLTANTSSTNWSWKSSMYLRNGRYDIQYSDSIFNLTTGLGNVYLYKKSNNKITITTTTHVRYAYYDADDPTDDHEYMGQRYLLGTAAVYNGKRYTDADGTIEANSYGTGQYGIDANGVILPLTYKTGTNYTWTYTDSDGQTQVYTGKRYTKTEGSNSSAWHDIYTITALYGQYIGSHFPIQGWNNNDYTGSVWEPQSSNVFTGGDVPSIVSMPDENTTFHYKSYGTRYNYYFYYYIETIDGNGDIPYSNKNFKESHHFTITARNSSMDSTKNEEFSDITGFTQFESNPAYNSQTNKVSLFAGDTMKFYYTRNQYTLTYNINYPTGVALTFPNNTQTPTNIDYEKKLYYQQSLADHEYSQEEFETKFGQALIAPDHYTFAGWYKDPTCKVPANFNEIMPAANMAVYAKWEKNSYYVYFDLDGGVMSDQSRRNIEKVDALDPIITPEPPVREYINVTSTMDTTGLTTYRYVRGSYVKKVIDERFIDQDSDVLISQYLDASDSSFDSGGALYNCHQKYDNAAVAINENVTEEEEQLSQFGFSLWHADPRLVDPDEYVKIEDLSTGLDLSYDFLGWYETDENGDVETGAMPYDFSKQMTHNVRLKAVWRMKGGYKLHYVCDYTLPGGTSVLNRVSSTTESAMYWIDPKVLGASYANGAKTSIYKQPDIGDTIENTTLYENGQPTIDYMFTGWQLVYYNSSTRVYTPITQSGGQIKKYDPGDSFTIDGQYASEGGDTIYMQATYAKKDSSPRRTTPTTLKLSCANDSKAYISTGEYDNEGVGIRRTESGPIGNNAYVYANVDAERIEFSNWLANSAIDLTKYAVTSTQDYYLNGMNYFYHQDNYFLLGFDKGEHENDYIATYPADSIISNTRGDIDDTIYAVWEPTIYLTLENKTSEQINISLTADPSTATLYIVNKKTSRYDREKLNDALNIPIAANSNLVLAIPNGLDQGTYGIKVGGTCNVGTGKIMSITSFFDYAGDGLNYSNADRHKQKNSDTLIDVMNVENLDEYTFSDYLELDSEGTHIVFEEKTCDNVIRLIESGYDDRTQEIALDAETMTANTYTLNRSRARLGYTFLGWSRTEGATTADYSVPSTIRNLSTFFQNASIENAPTEDDPNHHVRVVKLYAVFEDNTASGIVNIFNETPSPGDAEKEFTYKLHINAVFQSQDKTQSQTIDEDIFNNWTLQDGQYINIAMGDKWDNGNRGIEIVIKKLITSGDNYQAPLDTRTYTKDNPYTNGSLTINSITVSEVYSDEDKVKYTSSCSKINDVGQNPVTAQSQDTGSSAYWDRLSAGANLIFTNTRKTVSLVVNKVVENYQHPISNSSNIAYYVNNTNDGKFTFTFETLDGFDGYVRQAADAQFDLYNNESHKIDGIPTGTHFSITESCANDYYDTNISVMCEDGSGGLFDPRVSNMCQDSNVFECTVQDGFYGHIGHITFTNTLKQVQLKVYNIDESDNPMTNNSVFEFNMGEYWSAEEKITGEEGLVHVMYDETFVYGVYSFRQTVVVSGYTPINGKNAFPVTISAGSGPPNPDDPDTYEVKVGLSSDYYRIVYDNTTDPATPVYKLYLINITPRIAPSGLSTDYSKAFGLLLAFSGLICGSYYVLSKRRKEVGYDAI